MNFNRVKQIKFLNAIGKSESEQNKKHKVNLQNEIERKRIWIKQKWSISTKWNRKKMNLNTIKIKDISKCNPTEKKIGESEPNKGESTKWNKKNRVSSQNHSTNLQRNRLK